MTVLSVACTVLLVKPLQAMLCVLRKYESPEGFVVNATGLLNKKKKRIANQKINMIFFCFYSLF